MPNNIYPQIEVQNNLNPRKVWAIPFFGGMVKLFMIFAQVYLASLFMVIILPVLGFINSFNVLFNGRYWRFYHEQIQSFAQFYAEIIFFMYGVTDKYPSFRPEKASEIIVTVPYPENPNRLFAVPVLGGLVRFILLIPFLIYLYVVNLAAGLAYLFSFIVVLFSGRYPETTFELSRDLVRLTYAAMMYMSGISDKYPSFWISLNHKIAKGILLTLSFLYVIFYFYIMGAAIQSGEFNKPAKTQRTMTEEDFNQYMKDIPKNDTQYNNTNTQYDYNNSYTR